MRNLFAGAFLAALFAGCSAPPSTFDDVQTIRALQEHWNAAVETSDIDGYLSILDPEIELLPTDAPPIVGKEAYRAMLEGVFATDTFRIDVLDTSAVEVAGDWAWSRYDYVIHRTPIGTDQTFSSRRKYLDILRRQDDGSWAVYKHIWNYDTPDVVP